MKKKPSSNHEVNILACVVLELSRRQTDRNDVVVQFNARTGNLDDGQIMGEEVWN